LMPSFCRIKKIMNIEVPYFFDLPNWTHFLVVHYLFVASSSCMLKRVLSPRPSRIDVITIVQKTIKIKVKIILLL
jgi:hypothetical protein